MSVTNRLTGLASTANLKVPCRVATTANLTLSGLQTVDGVTLVAGDRVMVKDQTDETENGIYVADTGNWERAPDFDGNLDVVQGTLLTVKEGTVYAETIWRVTTADDITIDSSDIAFEQAVYSDAQTITFTQAGAGAVQRTLQSKERDVVSVLDFGAVGDGTTDDTVAIQAAIDMASTLGGRILYVMANHAISAPLVLSGVTRGFKIVGQGTIDASKGSLKAIAVMDHMFKFGHGTGNSAYQLSFENVAFDGNNLARDIIQMADSTTNSATTLEQISFDKCSFVNPTRCGFIAGDPGATIGTGTNTALNGGNLIFKDCETSARYGMFLNLTNYYGVTLQNHIFDGAYLPIGAVLLEQFWSECDSSSNFLLDNVQFAASTRDFDASTYCILVEHGLECRQIYSEHYLVLKHTTGNSPYAVVMNGLTINTDADVADGEDALSFNVGASLIMLDNIDLTTSLGGGLFRSRNILSVSKNITCNNVVWRAGLLVSSTNAGYQTQLDGMKQGDMMSVGPTPLMTEWRSNISPIGWVASAATLTRETSPVVGSWGGTHVCRITTTAGANAYKGLGTRIDLTNMPATAMSACAIIDLSPGALASTDLACSIGAAGANKTELINISGNRWAVIMGEYNVTNADRTAGYVPFFVGVLGTVANGSVVDIIAAAAFPFSCTGAFNEAALIQATWMAKGGKAGWLQRANNLATQEGAHYKLFSAGAPAAGTWVAGDIVYEVDGTSANVLYKCSASGTPGTWKTVTGV